MASLSSEIKIETELRPCLIDDKKGLFHRWCDISDIIEPSIMKGGHGGGVIKYTVGLVELENGDIKKYLPEQIRFTDEKIKDYCFRD